MTISNASGGSLGTTLSTGTIIDDDPITGDYICDDPQLTIPVSECQALLALYTGTNGDNWTTNSGWLLTGNVETRYGITLVLSGSQYHVRKIELGDETEADSMYRNKDGNNLSGSLVASIGDFPELTYLILSNNNISSSLPTTFGSLSKLLVFYMNDNNFDGSIPSGLGTISPLLNILLQNNNLTGSIPTNFGDLDSMVNLWLYNNNLGGGLPTQL